MPLSKGTRLHSNNYFSLLIFLLSREKDRTQTGNNVMTKVMAWVHFYDFGST